MTPSRPPFSHGGGPVSHGGGSASQAGGGGPVPSGSADAGGDAPLDGAFAADDPAAVAEREAAAIVESDLAQLESERSELVDTLRRVQADFENYRKRVLREQTALVDRATERLMEELLPVLDSFEGALAHASTTDEPQQIVDGVNGIRAQLVAVLEKNGLERIEADGAPFDPNEHEAVMQDEGDADPRVAQTMRTGYRLKGRVVRPAMVRVTREG
jgi:molecular chaperone GrpE